LVKPGAGFIWNVLTAARRHELVSVERRQVQPHLECPCPRLPAADAPCPCFPRFRYSTNAERGAVEHALRLVVKRTRVGYIYPANHNASAGNTTDPNIPAMGQRLRLKSTFAVPATWTKERKPFSNALKKYGGSSLTTATSFRIRLPG